MYQIDNHTMFREEVNYFILLQKSICKSLQKHKCTNCPDDVQNDTEPKNSYFNYYFFMVADKLYPDKKQNIYQKIYQTWNFIE